MTLSQHQLLLPDIGHFVRQISCMANHIGTYPNRSNYKKAEKFLQRSIVISKHMQLDNKQYIGLKSINMIQEFPYMPSSSIY